tara:strand:- start:407 stop:592 length:186 start_codon:yes stop_codon:yes gene_type:complete
MSAEYVYGLDKFAAQYAYQLIVEQLIGEGERHDIDAIANQIMDNSKLYPEFFNHPFFDKIN